MTNSIQLLEKLFKRIDEADLPDEDELITDPEKKQFCLLDEIYQEIYDFTE